VLLERGAIGDLELKKKKNTTTAKTKAKEIAVYTKISQNCDTIGWKFKVYVSSVGSAQLQKSINEFTAVQNSQNHPDGLLN